MQSYIVMLKILLIQIEIWKNRMLLFSQLVVPTCAHELPLGSVGADVLHAIYRTPVYSYFR